MITQHPTRILASIYNHLLGLGAPAAIFCLLAGTQVQAATDPIYSDNFDDQSISGWYNYKSSGGMSAETQQLVVSNASANFLTYFDSTTLNAGETLTVSMDLGLESVSDNNYGFRIGIFNSDGSQVTASDYGSSNALFNNYTGYRLTTNVGADTAGMTYFSKRDGTSDNIMGNDSMTNVGDSTAGVNLTSGTIYSTIFTFTRTETGTLELSFSMNGVTLNYTDVDPTFDFDTIAFYKSSGSGGNVIIDNVEVNLTTVPEAKESGMILGVLALLAAFFIGQKRLRNRRS